MATATCSAQAETWTLHKAHERLLADGRLRALTEAQQGRVRAEARASFPRNNPFVGLQREQSFGGTTQGGALAYSGAAENYAWIGQTFDLSFRRGLLDDAGARRAAAEGLQGAARQVEWLLVFDTLFYGAVANGHRLRAYDAWLARLSELAERTRAREQKGDASRYEVLRVEREQRKAQQARLDVELGFVAAVAELRAWLQDDAGDIAVDEPLAPTPQALPSSPPRPLRALAWDERSRALALEQEAASRWYLPPVTASVGGKTVAIQQGSLLPAGLEGGYLATLQVPIPVFERNDDKREALASERRSAELSAELEAQQVARRAEAARAVLATSLVALADHRAAAEQSGALVATARAAWAGGELSLLALLEAERAVLDDALVAIELAATARQADLVERSLRTPASHRGDHASD